jgi:fructosamine-3-kinase
LWCVGPVHIRHSVVLDVNGVERVRLGDGRAAVVKRGPAGALAAEAAGLRWIRTPDGPPVPEVLDERPGELVTAFVAPGPATAAAAEEFGRRLAALHGAGAGAFGAAPPGGPVEAWIGAAPMRNEPAPAWPTWYAGDRVLPYLRSARDRGAVDAADAAAVERVVARIGELAGPDGPPARLHGDLWTGNVLWSTDGAWLIDPAAHGGHRETDLAMLALFGCPHLDVVVAAYDEVAPLAPGWRERVPLHQLFPLLVHAVLFGAGYGRRAGAAARAVG